MMSTEHVRGLVLGLAAAAPVTTRQLRLLTSARGVTTDALNAAVAWHEHHGHLYLTDGSVRTTHLGRQWSKQPTPPPAETTAAVKKAVAAATTPRRNRTEEIRGYLIDAGGWCWSDNARRDLDIGRVMLSKAAAPLGLQHHRVGRRGVIALPDCTTHPISLHQTSLQLGVSRDRAELAAERLEYPLDQGFTRRQIKRMRVELATLGKVAA